MERGQDWTGPKSLSEDEETFIPSLDCFTSGESDDEGDSIICDR